MPILINQRGILEFVGEHDTGKTLAALQAVYPYKRTVFVDDDAKGDATVQQMRKQNVEFGMYINMGARRAKLGKTPTPKQLLELVTDIVDEIVDSVPKEGWEVTIWDTWRTVYQASRAYVERNQNEFRDVVQWRGNSQIVQGLVSRVARTIEQSLLNKLREHSELVIITHHIKPMYKNNVEVGVIPESSQTFYEISNMRVWLRRNPNSKVPIMLFLKRPNLPKVVKGRMSFVNIVPMKVVPNESDTSVWDAIARYEANPIESRKPLPEEEPTKEEMNLIKGTLSDDQLLYVMTVLKAQKEQEQAIVQQSLGGEAIPVSGIELISMAHSVYDLGADRVLEITGYDDDTLMELEGQEVRNAWKQIQQAAEQATIQTEESGRDNGASKSTRSKPAKGKR